MTGNPDVKTNGPAIPRHIAIIMDGNGRWARKRFLPRIEGHRAGAKTVRMVVEESRKLGVEYVTLFTFSTENWKRPQEEVSSLMKLLEGHLASELDRLTENGVRLRAIGDLSRLPDSIAAKLHNTIERTSAMNGMQLVLALSYGGRNELLDAVRALAREVSGGLLDPGSITEADISRNLYAPDIPDPDLLIRTSDEFRISNFLLWQLAYTEIVVSPSLWPEFSAEEFQRCISEYGKRQRRFGLTGEQVQAASNGETQDV